MRRFPSPAVFVGGVWLLLTLAAFAFVARFASPVPLLDDFELANFYSGKVAPDLAWYWTPHNEHRIPVPRAILLFLVHVTGDVRSGMWFQAIGLAGLSLASILLVRRIRGRTSHADAFFPLLFQHTGNAVNLLMGFQLALFVPVALAFAVPMLLLGGPPRISTRRAAAIGACLVVLPLCGGTGITQAPVIAAWCLFAGLRSARAPEAPGARARGILLAAGLVVAAATAAYAVGLRFPNTAIHSHDPRRVLFVACAAASLAFGPVAERVWPLSAAAIVVAVALAIGIPVAVVRTRAEERVRAAGVLACLLANLSLALNIGYGRGGSGQTAGFAMRYVTLTAPLLGILFLVSPIYVPARFRRGLEGLLCALLFLALVPNIEAGLGVAEAHAASASSIETDARAGLSIPDIVERAGAELYPRSSDAVLRLEALHRDGLPPFRGRPYEANAPPMTAALLLLGTLPDRVKATQPCVARDLGNLRVPLVRPGTELSFDRPSGTHRLEGGFGVPPQPAHPDRLRAARFTVEWIPSEGAASVLLERELDPSSRAADRDLQTFAVELPKGAAGSVVLRTSSPGGIADDWCWAYWTAIRYE